MSALIYFHVYVVLTLTRLQHLLHLDSIWDWSFSPRSRICSRRFCRTPRSFPPAAHVTITNSRYQAHDPHLSAAIPIADSADEDVLAAVFNPFISIGTPKPP